MGRAGQILRVSQEAVRQASHLGDQEPGLWALESSEQMLYVGAGPWQERQVCDVRT